MNFEMYNYSPPVLIGDADVLDQALRSNKCFVTLCRGLYILEFLIEGKEFRYITYSTERFESICEALRKNGIAIIAGNKAFNFSYGLAVAILFGLLVFALIR